MIRVTTSRNGSGQHLFVEGTLSDGWVEALETSWLEARSQSNRGPMRIDLSGVNYVDDMGRELLARMIRSGAKLRATGIMTRAVVEEIKQSMRPGSNGRTSRKRSKKVSPPIRLRPPAAR